MFQYLVLVCSVMMAPLSHVVFFFFKQKTAYEMRISDWSSDVCSSDLRLVDPAGRSAAGPCSKPVASGTGAGCAASSRTVLERTAWPPRRLSSRVFQGADQASRRYRCGLDPAPVSTRWLSTGAAS